VRFESLQSVSEQYFDEMNASDSFDFARCHLGEDRYFTHLLMEQRSTQYRIGYCSAARCKTEGCDSFYQLLKQRRRWYLGTLANEVHMLCSPLLWHHVPGLLTLQIFTSLKNGPLFLYVFVSEQVLGRGTWLTLGIAVLIFGPIWLFVATFGFKIHRRKIAWCYPFVVLLLPIMSALFQLYGIYTLRVRTWGGPRAANENGNHAKQEIELVVKDPVDK
jgi:chitin synthase